MSDGVSTGFSIQGDTIITSHRRRNSIWKEGRLRGDESTVLSSPDHGHAILYHRQGGGPGPEDAFSILSSPEPQGTTNFRFFRRVCSEEGSVPSSPEPGIPFSQTSALVGGSRSSIGEDADIMAMFSPDYQVLSSFARRSLAEDDGPSVSSSGSPESMLQPLRRFCRIRTLDASHRPTTRHAAYRRSLSVGSPEHSPPLQANSDGQPPLPGQRQHTSQAENEDTDNGSPEHIRGGVHGEVSSSYRGKIGEAQERNGRRLRRGTIPLGALSTDSAFVPRSSGTSAHEAAKPERQRQKSGAPEVSDKTASKVRAMREQLKSERFGKYKGKKDDMLSSTQPSVGLPKKRTSVRGSRLSNLLVFN